MVVSKVAEHQPATVVDVIPAGATLGECPVWDEVEHCLWWTDIKGKTLSRWHWGSRAMQTFPLPERLGSFGLTENAGEIVAAFETGFALFRPASGRVEWISRCEENYRGIRFNDGRVDPGGRFWAGTMVEDDQAASSASLYCLDTNQAVTRIFDGIGISNGICWSPAGDRFYFADSTTQAIEQFKVNLADGSISDRTPFARLTNGAFPDGADTDLDGYLWSAEWDGSRLTRYHADGQVARHITLPVSQPTCIAFGGPDLNHLFVTTARDGLSPTELISQPLAGDILVLHVTATGRPTYRYCQPKH